MHKQLILAIGIFVLGTMGRVLADEAVPGEEPPPAFRVAATGARFGLGVSGHGAAFHQSEAYLKFQLPWSWKYDSGFRLEPTAEISCGCLWDGHDQGVVAALGPGLRVGYKKLPLFLEGGINPTVISPYQYPTRNFGCNMQFTSYLSVRWDVMPRVQVGYRYQHMSNASLAQPNPGLNLHMFSLGWNF